MKKIKVIGLATAALLAVAPLLSTNVNAAINYNGTSYDNNATVSVGNASFARIPLNGTINTDAITKAFATPGASVSADISNVDTSVAGVYPVEVTATNLTTGAQTTIKINVTVSGSNNAQTIKGRTGCSFARW